MDTGEQLVDRRIRNELLFRAVNEVGDGRTGVSAETRVNTGIPASESPNELGSVLRSRCT